MTRADELLAYLFTDETHPLRTSMARWLSTSRRFTAFAGIYRDKMRKKIRVIDDAAAIRDLHHEFETAYLLVRERQFTVTYEPYVRTRPYGPDFAVAYTTSFTFNVEVTRVRNAGEGAGHPGAEPHAVDGGPQAATPRAGAEQVAEAICNKLYQLIPGMANVVVIGSDSSRLRLDHAVLAAELLRLKRRAESGEPLLFARHGFRGPSDFFRQYERLSGVVVRAAPGDDPPELLVSWVNPQAKRELPAKTAALLGRCLAYDAAVS